MKFICLDTMNGRVTAFMTIEEMNSYLKTDIINKHVIHKDLWGRFRYSDCLVVKYNIGGTANLTEVQFIELLKISKISNKKFKYKGFVIKNPLLEYNIAGRNIISIGESSNAVIDDVNTSDKLIHVGLYTTKSSRTITNLVFLDKIDTVKSCLIKYENYHVVIDANGDRIKREIQCL